MIIQFQIKENRFAGWLMLPVANRSVLGIDVDSLIGLFHPTPFSGSRGVKVGNNKLKVRPWAHVAEEIECFSCFRFTAQFSPGSDTVQLRLVPGNRIVFRDPNSNQYTNEWIRLWGRGEEGYEGRS